jgi:hypothetical protein
MLQSYQNLPLLALDFPRWPDRCLDFWHAICKWPSGKIPEEFSQTSLPPNATVCSWALFRVGLLPKGGSLPNQPWGSELLASWALSWIFSFFMKFTYLLGAGDWTRGPVHATHVLYHWIIVLWHLFLSSQFFFLVGLGFELLALCLGRYSTTWTTPPDPYLPSSYFLFEFLLKAQRSLLDHSN